MMVESVWRREQQGGKEKKKKRKKMKMMAMIGRVGWRRRPPIDGGPLRAQLVDFAGARVCVRVRARQAAAAAH